MIPKGDGDAQVQEECDHFSHYRQERDFETGAFTMTCSECDHQWTAPAPPLEVQVVTTIRAEATVDLVRYFTDLSDAGRKGYQTFAPSDEYEPWERPAAFLCSGTEGDLGMINVVPHRPFAERGMPQQVRENVEFEDWPSVEVRRRPGIRAYNWDWTEEDFDTLRAHVPWLDKFHETFNEEMDEEDLARIPGPLDKPLPFEEIT